MQCPVCNRFDAGKVGQANIFALIVLWSLT